HYVLAAGGIAPGTRGAAAMAYLGDLLTLKATEGAFQTAFLVLAVGFVVAAVAAAVLMRRGAARP
ncbi:MAG: hypothetical protein ACPGVX_12280, partial [Thalassobaculaceae bacterium]